jgi:hypothetical protein
MKYENDATGEGLELRPFADFEGVTFTSGWFVIRDLNTRGQDGQWLATREPVTVHR